MTNNSIIMLWRAGLGETLIIDKINNESCGYDVSIANLIILKNTGLPDNVISEMVKRCSTASQQRGLAGEDSSADPLVRHTPGIYMMADWLPQKKLQLVRPAKASGLRVSGLGSLVFPFMAKLVFPGTKSRNLSPNDTPSFYFYFDRSNNNVSDFGVEDSIAAQSPEEFSLVRFNVRENNREIVMGKMSSFAASKGIDPKFTIPVAIDEISSGTFKVSSLTSLKMGEYAFIFTGAKGNARVYDFSVQAISSANTATSN